MLPWPGNGWHVLISTWIEEHGYDLVILAVCCRVHQAEEGADCTGAEGALCTLFSTVLMQLGAVLYKDDCREIPDPIAKKQYQSKVVKI